MNTRGVSVLHCRLFRAGLCLLAAGAGLSAQAAPAAPPITVTVNGAPVVFTGTPPTESEGAVLVPLRGVFGALKADVAYDAAARTVHAVKGTTTILLPVGAATATVNGRPQSLSQPALTVGGTTLVPLRFIAEALGASVQWHPDTSTVEIRTAEPHLASLPSPPGSGPVEGEVTGVYADTAPQTITVRVNGRDMAVALTGQTTYTRAEVGLPLATVPLAQIAPGDEVQVQRDAQGEAVSVTATFGLVRGTLKKIVPQPGGGAVVTLNDGKVILLTPDAPVTMGNRRLALSDVLPDEQVVIRTGPGNVQGYGLALVTGSNPDPTPPGNPPPPSP